MPPSLRWLGMEQDKEVNMTEKELTDKFWKALKSDRTLMLGLAGQHESHTRPMTAIVEGEAQGPIWFFTSAETEIGRQVASNPNRRAVAAFASKGHDVFATIHGSLTEDTSPELIERLWNPFVGAWFEGKDDPKIRLLRLDPEEAEIWGDASSLIAGLKLLIGIDPKESYRDKVATVDLES